MAFSVDPGPEVSTAAQLFCRILAPVYEHTSYLLTLEREVPIETEVATWVADGEYQVRAITNSIPVELSTNMRAAFVTVFGGGGVDFLLTGDADSIIDLRGDIRDPSGRVVGTALVTATDATDITGVTPRVFGGLQFNISVVKLYGQVNVALPEGLGLHGGLRVAM